MAIYSALLFNFPHRVFSSRLNFNIWSPSGFHNFPFFFILIVVFLLLDLHLTYIFHYVLDDIMLCF